MKKEKRQAAKRITLPSEDKGHQNDQDDGDNDEEEVVAVVSEDTSVVCDSVSRFGRRRTTYKERRFFGD